MSRWRPVFRYAVVVLPFLQGCGHPIEGGGKVADLTTGSRYDFDVELAAAIVYCKKNG